MAHRQRRVLRWQYGPGKRDGGNPQRRQRDLTFTTPNTTAGRLPVGAEQAITAVYTPTGSFYGSACTLVGGETVTPATLTVSGVTAGNKVYDGTNAATLNLGTLRCSACLPAMQ